MPEAKHFGDTFAVRLNVWHFFQVERPSPDVLIRVFLWNLIMKKDNNWIQLRHHVVTVVEYPAQSKLLGIVGWMIEGINRWIS